MAWKDSTTALKYADEIEALKKQIKDNEASIAEQDSSLTARMGFIIALGILAGILAAVLVVGGVVLLRYILLTRKQQKDIQMLTDSNALKAQFISNIAGQLQPTFRKLDGNNPDVKALLDFSEHIQTLSQIENSMDEGVELEDTQISPFCEALADQIRDKVRKDVVLHVNAPKMSASINKEYVSRLLLHLLNNAAEYTPEEGTIVLEFKKRSAHTLQFLVSNTGSSIPEEKRDDVFKPFLEVRDLTKGDGLGLPICKQMARKMNGDLEIDPEFTKGVRFVLELHV
jgi:signal transduction histidine kinase